ncbi:DUF2283 domain-containing protein [Sphingomonas baiyangensis]|uniref:DUF2283 domain-containing protein n=1 Tax=Sphingomonas baiyangensis TaxID=2572576 RepID=A0A4U1L9E9_9SPHN|nr:DUF2283 domain-containing protein [Sphingomonas baiyangensis]TKD52946.1 DUF2283 domain-containing protein [Sphingomonas baiyangensis]
MKLHYYAETDSLYIELTDAPGVDTREIVEGVIADIDSDGRLVGIDIDGASRFDLSTLEAVGVPLTSLKAA